jgi:DNA-binding transcriptional ArsR family regulator
MEKQITIISEIFKVLSNPTRLRIMVLLYTEQEKCVKEISEKIGQKQSNTSFQLSKLKMKHLISCEKENNKTVCRITVPEGENIIKCILCIINGI